MGRDRIKVILPRAGTDDFWQRVEAHYAARDARKWKQLAMFALRETAGWPLELIGLAFQHHKGYVQRSLLRVKDDLRARFRPEADREGCSTGEPHGATTEE